jgi:hypothetical protein
MNAIAIVLVPTQEGQPLTEQAGATPSLDVWQDRIDRNNEKAASGENSGGQQTDSPFWTWFIENPRSDGRHIRTA